MNRKYSNDLLQNSLALIGLSVIIYFILILVAELWGRYTKKAHCQSSVLKWITIFGNCSFMGFPVVHAIYGDLGVFYAAVFNMFYIFLMFSYGIAILHRGRCEIRRDKVIKSRIGCDNYRLRTIYLQNFPTLRHTASDADDRGHNHPPRITCHRHQSSADSFKRAAPPYRHMGFCSHSADCIASCRSGNSRAIPFEPIPDRDSNDPAWNSHSINRGVYSH